MDGDESVFSDMDPTTAAVLKGNVNLLFSVFAILQNLEMNYKQRMLILTNLL